MYQIAMGYGCPDSAVCDTQYYGFSNQLYNAAHQFQRYTHNPTGYNFQVGITNQILYNPNTACGRKPVVVQNQATANLYDYTPYTPNAAALPQARLCLRIFATSSFVQNRACLACSARSHLKLYRKACAALSTPFISDLPGHFLRHTFAPI